MTSSFVKTRKIEPAGGIIPIHTSYASHAPELCMNFNHLAIFRAVADAFSISRAADRLLISQPAVSKQLAELERALKSKLVDRLPRGVRLTASGELLAGYARRIFAFADEGERAIAELAGLRQGRLVVAATPTIGVYWLPSLLVKYRRA